MSITQPFVDGLARSELLLPWCRACGRPHFYPRFACPHCWGENYDWRRASGNGTVHSFSEVRANPPTAFAPRLPYVIAIIDLDEGVRMMSNIVGEAADVAIGDRLRVEFHERDGVNLPLFRRVA
ncbi:MAG: Zn-ribbon domain-containing OB-fold protein [Roseiarcus sp.]